MELSWLGRRRRGQFVSYENVVGLPFFCQLCKSFSKTSELLIGRKTPCYTQLSWVLFLVLAPDCCAIIDEQLYLIIPQVFHL